MVICKLVAVDQQTPIIGAYLSPLTLCHLPYLEELLNCFMGRHFVVLGDPNADISRFINPRDQQVTDLLASFSMVDLLDRF